MITKEIPRFFEGVRGRLEVLAQSRVEIEAHLAKRFNVFHSIKFNENRISDVFAYLLRPGETHGQGELFLTALVHHLREDTGTQSGTRQVLPEDSAWSHVLVCREALTNHISASDRQVDIEISMRVGGKRVGIAIENKPSAKDLLGQLDDYAKHLDRKYKGQYLLLYLTPDRTPPTPESLPPGRLTELGDHFACVSLVKWAQGWLQEAENQVKASYVQQFVGDFRQVLLQKYADAETDPNLTMLS